MHNVPRQSPPSQREFTRKEIAGLFNVSVETIKRRTADGLLKPARPNARVIVYSIMDLKSLTEVGYRLDLREASALGISPRDIGHKASAWSEALSSRPEDAAPTNAVLPSGTSLSMPLHEQYAAEYSFLAQLFKALGNPTVRDQIVELVRGGSGEAKN